MVCFTAPRRNASRRPPKSPVAAKAPPFRRTIFAFDVKTGALKWTHQGKHISHVSIAIGDGRVFFIDASLTPEQRALMLAQDKTDLAKLTGKERELAEDRVKNNDLRMAVALDAKTASSSGRNRSM
jgi:hypothetical protein